MRDRRCEDSPTASGLLAIGNGERSSARSGETSANASMAPAAPARIATDLFIGLPPEFVAFLDLLLFKSRAFRILDALARPTARRAPKTPQPAESCSINR